MHSVKIDIHHLVELNIFQHSKLFPAIAGKIVFNRKFV